MATFRKVVLVNQQIYHVFNRGIERKPIFTNRREFNRTLETIKYYRFANLPLKFSKFLVQPFQDQQNILTKINSPENKLVELIAYCFMPNHFHFMLKQVQDNGISRFVSNFTNSYTKYFNAKHERNGPLVEGMFKAVLVETNEQYVHLSRYIHLNPVAAFFIKEQDLENYQWSSYKEYLGLEENGICQTEYLLENFKTGENYKKFVLDQVTYAQELEKIKHLLIEE